MKHRMYMLLSFVALVAILSATYFMVHTLSVDTALLWHRCAFASFLLSALCIEGRVRMGYRLPRGMLFGMHLSVAIPFFVLLGVLSLYSLPLWVSYTAFVGFCITLGTGAVLFTHGMKIHSPVILMKK